MAKRTRTDSTTLEELTTLTPDIETVDVTRELGDSYLTYALSTILARAIPDARDGLKPVQRRLIYAMGEAGLRPDRPHRKAAFAVAECMKTFHPHGDSSIYDTMVRLAQDWVMRVPLIDGHGNWGSPDDPAAASRYTEARLHPAGMALLDGVDDDTVDMVPNYDQSTREPTVLPAAYPNLLVNGAAGIAVGLATSIPPHNLTEVVAAAKHRLTHPDAGIDELLDHLPGPDFPTGGLIIGDTGIRDAYTTGQGRIRLRARTRTDHSNPRRRSIIVTELPYGVSPEQVITAIKEQLAAKHLDGIADIRDLTDASHGLQLVIDIKSGFDLDAVAGQLFRRTPLETTVSVNAVAIVDGRPETCTLTRLLDTYLAHRYQVLQRRTRRRLTIARDRAHLVAGLLLALDTIETVIAAIRAAKDAKTARAHLQRDIGVTALQADYILEMPLRRLTSLEAGKLRAESRELAARIRDLDKLLGSPRLQQAAIAAELDDVTARFATPRRTTIVTGKAADTAVAATAPAAPASLEVADTACHVTLTTRGGVARLTEPTSRKTSQWPVLATVETTTRGQVAAVTSDGRVAVIDVTDLPALDPTSTPKRRDVGGTPAADLVTLTGDQQVIGLAAVGATIGLVTAAGTVKRVAADAWPSRAVTARAGAEGVPVIALTDGDRVVWAGDAPDGHHLTIVTTAAQLLRFDTTAVRAQGRPAGGMAGVRLDPGDQVLAAGCGPAELTGWVVATVTDAGHAKQSPAADYPTKGRGTGGVRCHTWRKGDQRLTHAYVGLAPVACLDTAGQPAGLPDDLARRDATGQPLTAACDTLAHLP